MSAATPPLDRPPRDHGPFIDTLLADARLVASYGRYAGTFKDDSFFRTMAEVDELPDRRLSHEPVIRLQRLLNDGVGLVPFTTLSALKSGWDPNKYHGPPAKRPTLLLMALVVVSMLLMGVTGRLTYVHNKGVAIVQELESLTLNDPRETYNRLLRDLAQASEEVEGGAPVATAAQLVLARNAYFDSQGELVALSERLALASGNAQSFLTYDANFPVWGVGLVRCSYRRLTNLLFGMPTPQDDPMAYYADAWLNDYCRIGSDSYRQLPPPERLADASASVSDGVPGADEDAATTPTQASAYAGTPRNPCSAPTQETGGTTLVRLSEGSLGSYENAILQLANELNCDGLLKVTPTNFPPLSYFVTSLNDTLTPYALWFLPALYGMMGALMFHLRMILDPLRPNPETARVLHRVVLGGLAGIVLAWFYIPDSRLGREIVDIGFSLFALAFLFGFSLDVFFAILDKFVSVSETAIRRFGTGPQPVSQVVVTPRAEQQAASQASRPA